MAQTHKFTHRPFLLFGVFLILFLGVHLGLWFISEALIREPVQKHEPASDMSTEMPPIIVIDAGHGGEDGGAVGINGIYEKDINLAIAKRLEHMLHLCGYQTVMTRTEDVLLYDQNSNYQGQKKIQDLQTRKKIAEQYDNSTLISIHMNSFPQEKYSGLQVYYSPNEPTSSDLANTVQSNAKELLLPNNNRQIKRADGSIYLLYRTHCPAILIECGFLSNAEECAKLSDPVYQQQLAMVICQSIIENLSANRS